LIKLSYAALGVRTSAIGEIGPSSLKVIRNHAVGGQPHENVALSPIMMRMVDGRRVSCHVNRMTIHARNLDPRRVGRKRPVLLVQAVK